MQYWAEPLNDAEILSLFEKVAGKYENSRGTISTVVRSFDISSIGSDDLTQLKKYAGNSIYNFTIGLGGAKFLL